MGKHKRTEGLANSAFTHTYIPIQILVFEVQVFQPTKCARSYGDK